MVVLPPGEWDPTIRLPPPESPRKRQERLDENAAVPMPSKEKTTTSAVAAHHEKDDLPHAGLKRSGRYVSVACVCSCSFVYIWTICLCGMYILM